MTASRTWLITGVSRGLGRQMAERLLARGDRVAGTARKPMLRATRGEQATTR